MADNIENERIWSLMAKQLSGEISQDEVEELRGLLKDDSYGSHVNKILVTDWKETNNYYQPEKVAALYQKLQGPLAEPTAENIELTIGTTPPEQKGKIKTMWRYAAAACIITALLATWKFRPSSGSDKPETAYRQQLVTQKGARSQVLLPDGSKVWLNAGSTLDYPKQFNGKTRNVQLQGEAYFEIAKDAEKPFFVHTKAFDIKVLGTGFNVRAYPDEDSAVTALVHGSVEVIVKAKGAQRIFLHPNEKITLPTNTIVPIKNEEAVVSKIAALTVIPQKMIMLEDTVQLETAWINNKLAFKKMHLEDVALLLEKWFGADIRFKNDNKKTLNFTGVFEGEKLDDILSTLEATGSFHYKKDSNGVIWIE